MATFNETCAPISRKCVAEQGIVMPILSEKVQFLWSHSSVSTFQNQPKNLNLYSLFTSKTPFGGYFQGNVSTHFQKRCIWTRQKHSGFSKETSSFLVTFLLFGFRKATVKSKFSEFFVLVRDLLVANLNEMKHVVVKGIVMPNWSKTFETFWSHSSVFV